MDAVPGTTGNDTINAVIDATLATPTTTWTALDSIDGGAGTDTLKISAITDFAAPGGATVTNVEKVQIAAAAKVGTFAANAAGDVDLSTVFAGVTDLTITSGSEADFKAGTSTAVNLSGVTGGVEVVGGASQTVSLAAQGGSVALSGTTGAVSFTSAKHGNNNVAIDGGSTVTVATTSTVDNGTITIGATTPATGAVSVTSNLNGDGTATLDQGNIAVTGGSTVTVNSNLTITAKNETADDAHTFGDVTVTGDGKTTSVTVNQTYAETEFTKAAVAVVKELHTVTFKALAEGETTIVDGLTFTASKALTAAEVAQAFANLTVSDTQTSGGKVANGIFSGALSGNFTSGAANGAVVVFTAKDEAEALSITTGAIDPTETVVAGTAAAAAVTSSNTMTYGAVRIDDVATASITTVTVNGYGSADLGATGVDLNALTTLSLTNSGGSASVATSATTLNLSLNNVNHAVDLDQTAATIKTLNITASGNSSSFALTAAAVTTANIDASADLNISAGTFAAVETVTVTGAGDVNLGDISGTATSVAASAATGNITATVDGTKAVVTTGTGNDAITVDTAGISKAITLGAGDDTLILSAATANVPTAAVAGGDGVDTVSMTFASAQALDANTNFKTAISGFERLTISNQAVLTTADVTIDLEALGFNYVTLAAGTDDTDVGAANKLILDKMASGGTLVMNATQAATAAQASTQVNVTDAATGTADVLNIVISAQASVDAKTIIANDVETFNITATDVFLDNGNGNDTNNAIHTLIASGDKVTSIVVTGDDLILDTNSTVLTSVNASAMTGGITYTADGKSTGTTVLGGQGADNLTASGSGDTLNGGAGADTLTGANLTTLTGGAGNDTFVVNVPSNVNQYSTITDLSSGDIIQLTAGETFVSSAITLANTAVFQDYANAAVNQLATDDEDAAWFQFGGNTYVVINDNQADVVDADFENGADAIIQIVGLVDLSTASYNLTNGTLEIA